MIAAHDAVGCVRQAVRDVCQSGIKRAFCAVRPPGHHAMPDNSMGFCLFNNIFIGARLIQNNYGYQRIAIVDFDVHHGNGTEAMTRLSENILYISSHQWPFYPGTGAPEDQVPGKTVNGTLPEGAGGDDFRTLYTHHLLPAIDEFAPEILLISAGFDAHERDPLGGLNLTSADFSWITHQLVAIADKHCDGRIISVLEGGYDLQGLEDGLCAHLEALQ
jgi:acetoin utilization deacetylase AcuC-like enzyme